ncbi:MAG TPA: 30S ribosomal protein S17e [Thermoplasmatales archaeon]|nr:30S ribosomal protein S17e [Thermoplasmatales archaeon]
MGNIRQLHIKQIAIQLVEKFPDQFSKDFQHNKKKVAELTDITSKEIRNRVAGYLTRYYSLKFKNT